MNLAWLAAVLSPRDVALHPNFGEYRNDLGPAFLAAVVLGDDWRLVQLNVTASGTVGSFPDQAIAYVRNTFNRGTMEQGIVELSDALIDKQPADAARSCALALLACCAAAELDDYETCDKLLDDQLRWTSGSSIPDDRLIQAALLQQRSLRFRDSGRPHRASSIAALRVLADIDIANCSTFDLSQSVSWSSRETVAKIVSTIRDAAYSLFSTHDQDVAETDDLVRSRRERIQAPDVQYLLQADQQASAEFSDFVTEIVNQYFSGSNSWSLTQSQMPDLFYVTLAFELAGHGEVYRSRLQCAQLRIAEAAVDINRGDLTDVLRLLRHAASKKYVDLALNWLRGSGPLEVLGADARRIVRFRSSPKALRSVELRVLTAAAEILTEEEADTALNAVVGCLNSGGPPNLPGEWELDIIRIESAWRAAAALGNTAGRANDVVQVLFNELSRINGDQVRDGSVARAFALIEWANVPPETKRLLTDYVSANHEEMPAVASVLAPVLGSSVLGRQVEEPNLDTVAILLNVSIRGGAVDKEVLDSAIPQVRDALRLVRESESAGHHSIGSPIGDIAAGMVVYAGADDLWPDLVTFLIDPTVLRMTRSPAFERLAREVRHVPSGVREVLTTEASSVLHTPESVFGSNMIPYPEALRFLASVGVISDMTIIDSIGRLAGLGREGRREAARTLDVVSRNSSDSWLFGFATELSHDEDVETRASAGRCLVRLAASSSEIGNFSQNRLLDLLKQDGLLVPVLVLRGLQESSYMTDDIRSYLRWMRNNHVSRSVRQLAIRLLD